MYKTSSKLSWKFHVQVSPPKDVLNDSPNGFNQKPEDLSQFRLLLRILSETIVVYDGILCQIL